MWWMSAVLLSGRQTNQSYYGDATFSQISRAVLCMNELRYCFMINDMKLREWSGCAIESSTTPRAWEIIMEEPQFKERVRCWPLHDPAKSEYKNGNYVILPDYGEKLDEVPMGRPKILLAGQPHTIIHCWRMRCHSCICYRFANSDFKRFLGKQLRVDSLTTTRRPLRTHLSDQMSLSDHRKPPALEDAQVSRFISCIQWPVKLLTLVHHITYASTKKTKNFIRWHSRDKHIGVLFWQPGITKGLLMILQKPTQKT